MGAGELDNHGPSSTTKYIFYIATHRRCGKALCRGSRTASSSRALSFADFKPGGSLAWVGAGDPMASP